MFIRFEMYGTFGFELRKNRIFRQKNGKITGKIGNIFSLL